MRDLIISIAAVALLIGTWLVFFDYSSDNIDSYTHTLKKEIIPAVEAGQWEESKDQHREHTSSVWLHALLLDKDLWKITTIDREDGHDGIESEDESLSHAR